MTPGLGRRWAPDERDGKYPARAALPPRSIRPWRYFDSGEWTGDQGSTSQCVAYAWLHWLEAGPSPMTHPQAGPATAPRALYDAAQQVDEWPGTDYSGTSVRAGAKVLQGLGLVKEYRWATTVEEVALALVTTGPVVLGTRWDEPMFEPDAAGFVHPDGRGVDGHAFLALGANRIERKVRCLNSWGDWGQGGRFWIRFADLEGLLADQGEACLAIEARPLTMVDPTFEQRSPDA